MQAQLAAVMARSSEDFGSASGASLLQQAKFPAAEASPTAELRTNPARLNPASSTPSAKERVHVVRAGETLEQLARHYFNDPEYWRVIRAANPAILGDGWTLEPGMRLRIPTP
jgi:nucleoid-associated protein YgaU